MAFNEEPADSCHCLPSGDAGTVGAECHKSSATKSPVTPVGAASGTEGVGSGVCRAAALPSLAANRQKPNKTVRLAKQPMIVLVMDSPSNEFTFDNKEKDGTPRVSFHSVKKKP